MFRETVKLPAVNNNEEYGIIFKFLQVREVVHDALGKNTTSTALEFGVLVLAAPPLVEPVLQALPIL
jgi:hypothetical protein